MSYLSYKAERAGRRVVKVDPRNTSKTFVRVGTAPRACGKDAYAIHPLL